VIERGTPIKDSFIMSEKKVGLGLGGSWVFMSLLAFLLAYFQYGTSINAGLGMILTSLVLEALSLIGLIPFIGVFIYYFSAIYYILPLTLNFVQLSWSWVIDLFLYLNLIMAALLTIATSYLAYKIIT